MAEVPLFSRGQECRIVNKVILRESKSAFSAKLDVLSPGALIRILDPKPTPNDYRIQVIYKGVVGWMAYQGKGGKTLNLESIGPHFKLQIGFYYVADVDLSIKGGEEGEGSAIGLLRARDAFLCVETRTVHSSSGGNFNGGKGGRRMKIQDAHGNVGWITFETKTGMSLVEDYKQLAWSERAKRKIRIQLQVYNVCSIEQLLNDIVKKDEKYFF